MQIHKNMLTFAFFDILYSYGKEKEQLEMIGDVLKQILAEKNINANELAKRVGISNQTLYSILKRNNMKVDFSILLKICEELDVDIERFYGDYLKEKQKNTNNQTSIKQKELTSDEEKLLTNYNKLNTDGKDKVQDYTKDLTGNKIYTDKLQDKLHA